MEFDNYKDLKKKKNKRSGMSHLKNINEDHFSPFIGEGSSMMCVGRTRSGKSYLKNVIASHLMNCLGNSSVIDIDPDFETLLQRFEDEGI